MSQRLGPYSLVQQIAVGGMAEVYLAEGPLGSGDGAQRQVAIKVIHPQSADDPQLIAMLIDEARLAVQLQHQNIVATYDLGQEGGEYYIVMEYVPGADLFRILRRAADLDESFPVEAAALVAREVAAGLDYAHRKRDQQGRPLQIIHRDISPQNVLLSPAGQVKLTDFGIAKAAHRTGQTRAGVIKGKYYYMSPEQAWGDPVDTRTDIFSAGILLYEMLVGQMLYLEDNIDHLVDAVRKAEIAPPSQKRDGIPRDLEQIVMRALQKRSSDRWQTAGDYAQALTDFLRGYAPGYGAVELGAFIGRLVPARAGEAQPVVPVAGPVVQADPNSLLFRAPELQEELLGDQTSVDQRPGKRAVDQGTRALRDPELDGEPTTISPPLLDLPGMVSRRGPLQSLAKLPAPRQERAETRKVSRPESWEEPERQPAPGPRPEHKSEPVQRRSEHKSEPVQRRPEHKVEPQRPVRQAGPEQWAERADTRKVPASALSPPPTLPSPPPVQAPPPAPQQAQGPLPAPPVPQQVHAPLPAPPVPQQAQGPLPAPPLPPSPPPVQVPPPAPQQVQAPQAPPPAPMPPFVQAPQAPPPAPMPPFVQAPQAPPPAPMPPFGQQPFAQQQPPAPVFVPSQEQVPNYLAAAPPLPRWENPTDPSLGSVSQQLVPERKPRRLALAFLGAVILGAAGVALLTLLPEDTRQGQLEITSNPAGAVVRVDGAPIGTPTPVRLLNLDLRLPHRISLSKPGYRSWETEVRFEAAERAKAVQAVLARE